MLFNAFNSSILRRINGINYLKSLKYGIAIKNVYPALKIKNKQSRTFLNILRNRHILHLEYLDTLKSVDQYYLFLKYIFIDTHQGIKQLLKMNDVTQLANLAEEEQKECEKSDKLCMHFDDNYFESDSESLNPDIEIVKIQTPSKLPTENKYQHSFNINKHHYKHIIGKKGETLKKLCNETNTIIRVSKKKKHVVIIGAVQKRIIHAKHEINKIVQNSKNKLRFTHFISIPTNTDDIKENFIKFKQNVLKNCDVEATGFHEGMFQKPEKLHLTISMLHLLENKDEEKAIKALETCKSQIINPILNENTSLSMEFKGLKCMENNSAKAKVLYVKVHENTGLLQKLSDEINDYFLKQGLSRKDHDSVTLHLTVINTFYLKKKKHKCSRKNFDATSILKDHEDTLFGKINLSTFHLSKLTAKSADGYFEALSKIEF